MRYFVFIWVSLQSLLTFGQAMKVNNELLWEISGNGLTKKSYLYGSLHSNDKRLFQLSDSTYYALNATDAIVLETDIFSLFNTLDTRKGEVNILYDNQGKVYTGSNRATKTVYGDEDGMPQFLDAYFQEYGYNAGKKFYPLEKVEDQIDLVADIVLPDADRISYIASELVQEKMIDLYLEGDIQALEKIIRVNLVAFPGTYDDLIVNRNLIMAKGLDTLIRKEAIFCAVGAGHLAGDQGIIQLLRKRGYKLRKVSASFSEIAIKEKVEVKSKRGYSFSDEETGLVAIFPGKPLQEKVGAGNSFLIYREMGQGNTYSVEIIPTDGSLSLSEQAAIYIASPGASPYNYRKQDDETELIEGIANTYTEGYHWVRIMQNESHLIVMKAYGGNKFMNSNRPFNFFDKIWFEY